MSITATVTDQWQAGNRGQAIGTLAFAGSYTTGGVVCNLGTGGLRGDSAPSWFHAPVFELYSFKYVPGASAREGSVKVYLTSTGAELSAAAFPAALLAAAAPFECVFAIGL